MKKIWTALAILAFVSSMTFDSNAQKNEIEFRPYWGISDQSLTSYGADLIYRRNTTKRLGLFAGYGRGVLRSDTDINITNLQFGASVALSSTRKGFYFDLAKIYEVSGNIGNENAVFEDGTELGLGYKLPLSRNVFVNARLNKRWGVNTDLGSHFGVGIKF